MTKPLNEEEYQKFMNSCHVSVMPNYRTHEFLDRPDLTQHEIESVRIDINLRNLRQLKLNQNQILALINPITKDYAHDLLVKKDKKYAWRYKKKDTDGDTYYLAKECGLIAFNFMKTNDTFTEKEVVEAGYNPDMFDKEEVE
ncbi:hypothetical protein [Fructobacillus fructosus]|uniref:hypothetical protein n=1 Tax=Fructobacillus fructosus TaxID=1631 RepID=UPI002DB4C347|nr:hypothetical protein LMG30235_GOPAMIKF_01436 [Fructobacillus fructosus]CAK1252690.1 hypothetical protein R54866_LGPIEIPA_01505 [Fructobacillus fructosus]CAK1252889.1 hypothetical protein LMG30234_GAICNKDF_01519 [Fructobacillus fructosus]